MSNSVTIRVPARLHLGFLDLNGDVGRRFGSVGLPLSEPETVVTLSLAAETSVEGSEAARAEGHLSALCRHLGIKSHHRLMVEQAIPSHAGLGSGTQIALAVAAALRTLHGLPLDIAGDAVLLARGARSGIGIASFESGGVIVDAGKSSSGRPPPVVARLPFPDEWRVLLILDEAVEGLHGQDELQAFRALPQFPAAGAGEICRQVLMGLMPALVERDLPVFGAAVTTIQTLIGTHFAPAQGGVFTSRRVEALARRLADAGAVGIGQSSWGPTGFAFAPSEDEARRLVDSVRDAISAGIEIRIVQGRNSGAKISQTKLDLVGS
ncbi:beta-ribofuranosylaminobenzene 5'-phosphate synthase family protein [Allomesorhizobium camelthorni]|uniref:GHMP kinase n=1 Tax=Allomesorhizobium camelthorni TaxID=475069 RepID=A0A6G4WKV3_9HYPH|nr:beta-ribofuranosylaminobenzene 5'-phosphate synthase family protein [Mesorhizobium camelthorni]NGO54813.1 GHMP kinase [Mesorhizobium camelthorni]